MQQKKFFLTLTLIMMYFAAYAQRNCGSMHHHDHLIKENPSITKKFDAIEKHTQSFLKSSSLGTKSGTTEITIPVVVHVLYKTSSENISEAQILSQIAVLNQDFTRTNADRVNTPAAFAPLAANVGLKFVMASTDPSGNATNGITRKYVNKSSWGTNDAMKKPSSSGVAPWDPSKYMNVWICNIGGGILGYAQFPGGPASTDGVVISPQYFGTTGYVTAPFNKGRTATHEVGHYLNLRHIWGDGGCGASDYVDDTPDAASANYGCPSHPSSSCGTNDMFMNYMDYVDDACMNMFTTGQKNRMRALFAPGGAREGLGTVGGGTTDPDPGTTSYCESKGNSVSDEWIANVTIGSFSNTSTASSGYTDFTSKTIELSKGSENSITLTPGFAGSAYNEYWKIWIDYNNDGDFSDSGEEVFSTGGVSSSAVSGKITIPTSVATGSTRMRVSMKYNGAPTACEAFSYGEVEDYTVKIIDAVVVTPAPTSYCASKGSSTADEWIKSFQMGSINNVSNNNNGYGDFTSISTNIQQGSTYSFTIKPGWAGTVYSEAYRIWIDYNKDGDFNDAGEQVFTKSRSKNATITGSFTVPAGTELGATRMRVSMKYNANPTACETFQYGEVEDYIVVLQAGSSRVINDITEVETIDFNLYPNPTTDKATISIDLGDNENNEALSIQMMNLQGQMVRNVTLEDESGIVEHTFETTGLTTGVYLVKVSSGRLHKIHRLIVR